MFKYIIGIVLSLLICSGSWAQSSNNNIVIFYSSVGAGHISAAKAIKADIEEKDKAANVELKDIRDFMGSPTKEKINQSIFWLIVKKAPNLFDKLFRGQMDKGNRVNDFDKIKGPYSLDQLHDYIKEKSPSKILSTHYGSTVALINLRDADHISKIPVGWLHTDYFKGFFPRISKQIEKTFLPIDALKEQWLAEKVSPKRIEVTGMPLPADLKDPVDKNAFFAEESLKTEVKTVTIASGKEGVGNYPEIVKEIVKSADGKPIQIIAVNGQNKKNFDLLTKLKPKLPSNVTLKVEGFIPIERLMKFVKSSDLYITKSGGLSPAEAFGIGKPVVLLDIYGGHERDNAELFEKLELAVVNRDMNTLHQDINRVLTDESLVRKMLEGQTSFYNSVQIGKISDFALSPEESKKDQLFRLGVEGGSRVKGSIKALAELDKKSPVDVEILLSYAKTKTGAYSEVSESGARENPFGHLGIRIKDTVYTANGLAKAGVDKQLLYKSTLNEYLYGVKPGTVNQEHTDSFGNTYGRDVISLRVKGLDSSSVDKMIEFAEDVNRKWLKKEVYWHRSECNCADFVQRILAAGGLESPVKKLTMPADIFEYFEKTFANTLNVRSEVVMYNKIKESKNYYQQSRYPVSVYQLKKSFKRMWQNYKGKSVEAPLETKVGHRIASYNGTDRVMYESVESGKFKGVTSSLNNIVTQAEVDSLYSESQKLEKSIGRWAEYFNQIPMETLLSKVAAGGASNNYMKKWTEHYTKLEEQRNRLNLIQSELAVKVSVLEVSKAYNELVLEGAKGKDINKLKTLAQKISSEANKYFELESLYGEARDYKRISRLRSVLFKTRSFYTLLAKVQGTTKSQSLKTRIANHMKSIPQKLKSILEKTKLLPEVARLVKSVFVRKAGSPHIMESVNALFKKKSLMDGFEVEIKNKERLNVNLPKNTVNVYVPTHQNPILDTVAMAHVGVNNALLFAAPDQFSPKFIADRIEKNSNLIFVGRGSGKPLEQTLGRLASGDTRTLFIYPEGSTATFGETRPLRKNFYRNLLAGIREAGYGIRIVPITYRNNGRLLSLATDALNSSKKLDIHINKAIEPEVANKLVDNKNYERLFTNLIKNSWSSKMPTTAELIGGQYRTSSVIKLLSHFANQDKPAAGEKFGQDILENSRKALDNSRRARARTCKAITGS